jgi:hypothetical protein
MYGRVGSDAIRSVSSTPRYVAAAPASPAPGGMHELWSTIWIGLASSTAHCGYHDVRVEDDARSGRHAGIKYDTSFVKLFQSV